MNTRMESVKIYNLEVNVLKKNIKNIHLGVYPPNGRIRVAAPLKTTDEAIKLLVISRIPWIKRQQSRFINQERQTKREYISGESHFFMGNRYLLNVVYVDSEPKIEIKNKNHIDLYVRLGTTIQKKGELLDDFYRSELKKYIPSFITKWQDLTGISVEEFKIKKMKTKWGTCNPEYKRVWLNLELAKKPIHCSEYVLVHEMVHLIEKNHTDKFQKLMESFMPQWKRYKDELNDSVLGYSNWKY